LRQQFFGKLRIITESGHDHGAHHGRPATDRRPTSFNQGNAKAVAGLYAPDAQLVMSGAPPIRGTADIRRAIEEMIKTDAKVHIDVETNVGAGDIAYVYGSYTISDGKAGREIERGHYVEVWRRLDGAWAIVLDVNAVGEPLRPKSVVD
jgi:uncharacterized protein (TIGR02246 family)